MQKMINLPTKEREKMGQAGRGKVLAQFDENNVNAIYYSNCHTDRFYYHRGYIHKAILMSCKSDTVKAAG